MSDLGLRTEAEPAKTASAAGGRVQISVLGELTVRQRGRVVPIPAPKQRMLLALLIVNLRRSVSLDRTLETLYGDRLPGNPPRALRFHVSKLRAALEPDAPATRRTGVIQTTPNGYQLDVDPATIDAHRFAALANQAVSLLSNDPEGAASSAAEALELWTGEPLAEFEYEDFAQPLRTELLERRLALDETRIEAMLAVGDNDGAIALLRPLTEQHPYREGLYSLLMTALYRAGRQVDALAVYEEARALLLEDLGIDPGPELVQLEHQILTQAPGLLPTAFPWIGHNLPPAVPVVGREEAEATLRDLISAHRFVQVTGLPGVGKSALAVAVAHKSVDSFSDGVLYIKIDAGMADRQIIENLAEGISTIGPRAVDDGNVIRTIAGMDLLVVIDDGHRSTHAVHEVVGRVLADGDRATVLETIRTPSRDLPGSDFVLEPLEPATDGVTLLRKLAAAGKVEDDLETIAERTGGVPGVIEVAATALRVETAAGTTSRRTGHVILDATRADLADEVAAGLPEAAVRLAQHLALFSEGLTLDEMIEILDPTMSSATVLDNLSILAATGVAVVDPHGYRIAPVLAASFDEALLDRDRRSALERAVVHFTQAPGSRLPANADGIAHRLIAAGEARTALHLLARLGRLWWQQAARVPFADLCRSAIEASDGPVDRDLEATLFFAAHAFLDLGDEATALGYAAQYVDVAAKLDEPSVQMHAHQLRGNVSAYTGAFVDAATEYSAALDLGRRIGHPEATWIAGSRATISVLLGDAEGAFARADEVEALATIHRQVRGQGRAAELRGSAAFQQGDADAAAIGFSRAREIAASCGAAREEIIALHRLAEHHIVVGDLEAAARCAESAAAVCDAVVLPEPPPLIAVAAMVAAEQGNQDLADHRLADLQGSLRYRRPAVWVHGAMIAAAVVNASADRHIEAALRVAALDDLGKRTGIVLPQPWVHRIDRIRGASSDERASEFEEKARLTDPVNLVS